MFTALTRQNIHSYSVVYFQTVRMRPLGDEKQNLKSEMTHREQI